VSGIFVRVAGETDGMIHVSQLNGGSFRATRVKVGDTIAKVAVISVKDVVRRGQPDLEIKLSETQTFDYAVGDTMRGAEFIKTLGHDLVFDVGGFEVFVSEENLGTVKRESVAKKGQKTNLKFVGWNGNRICGSKA
jgi:ribosomal protein S1